jgi:hypothetical protein
VDGAGQHRVPVLDSEDRRQLGDPRQMKTTIGQHVEERRVFPPRSGRSDAQVRLRFRQVQHLDTVGEHRGHGLAGVETSLVHPDVGHEIGLAAAGQPEKLDEVPEQLVVLYRSQRVFAHGSNCKPGTGQDRSGTPNGFDERVR